MACLLLAFTLMKTVLHTKSSAAHPVLAYVLVNCGEGSFELVAVKAQKKTPRVHCLGIRRGAQKSAN